MIDDRGEDIARREEIAEAVEKIMRTLTPLQSHVITIRYGFLDGIGKTDKATGALLRITPRKVYAIKKQVFKKFRQPENVLLLLDAGLAIRKPSDRYEKWKQRVEAERLNALRDQYLEEPGPWPEVRPLIGHLIKKRPFAFIRRPDWDALFDTAKADFEVEAERSDGVMRLRIKPGIDTLLVEKRPP